MNKRGRTITVGLVAMILMTAGGAMAGSLDPTNAPGPTMHTLEEIYQIVIGLSPPTVETLSDSTTIVEAGYYASTNLVEVDTDLASANIRAGVTIFGLSGKTEVVDTTSGDATGSDMKAGKKAWVDGVEITGTIPTQTLSPDNANVAEGWYAGTTLTSVDSDLVSGNVRAGVTIFGVSGKTEVVDTTSGTAAADDMKAGKVAWVDGVEITGNIPTQTLSPGTANVPAGYYAVTNLTQVDTELATGNIRAGITLFGVPGKTEVVDTTTGDALAAEIMAGKIAWVDGVEITGNIPTQTLTPANANVPAGYYAVTNLTQVDTDLATANIHAGITLFGVPGKAEVVDTTTGDALAGELMAGKKAWVDGSEVTGTLPTRTLTPSNDVVSAGYYAATNLTQVDSDLVTGNIHQGKTLFGVGGKFEVVDTTTGDAIAGDIKTGKKAWVDGAEVTGTIQTRTLTPASDVVAEGFYAATNLTMVDADLATANIHAGITIFGVAGKNEVVDTTTGDALAGELMAGKKAWVDGAEVTGTLPTQTLSPANDTVSAGYYAATTLHDVDGYLATANIHAGITIFGIPGKTEVVDTTSGNAVASDIKTGRKAWVDGVEIQGTIQTRQLSSNNTTVAEGFYNATTLDTVDPDLVTANIRAGISIFGVPGKTEVVDTTTGDAIAGDIKSGKKAWVDGNEVTGTILTRTLSSNNTTVAEGFYNGTTLDTVDPDLATANIRAGITIFGVPGKNEVVDTTSGDALAGELMAGKIAWVDGAEVVGTLPTQTLTPSNDVVSAGYYAATNLTQVDTDLVTGNIRQGITVFGVNGKTEVADTSSGTAIATDIKAGNVAWVDGVEVTGTLPTRTLTDANDTVQDGYYEATTLSSVDTDLVTGNVRQGITLFGVNGKYEVVDTTSGTASAGDMKAGTVAWVDGSEVTGTIQTRTLAPTTDVVPEGFYSATNLTLVDTDLVTGNIHQGITMFGVAGKYEVVDTTTGDAIEYDIRAGKKAWVDGDEITGTLPTRTLSPATTVVQDGYYVATNLVQVDADLVTGNIHQGKTLFGVAGKYEVVDTTTGDAVAYDVMEGKKAWVDGNEVTGTLPTRTLSPATTTVQDGYYVATNLVQVDADLVTGNIRQNQTLFGVLGRYEVADTTSGDAIAYDVMEGKKAWVDGNEVTGTLPTRTLSALSTTVQDGYYQATDLTTVDPDLATPYIHAGITMFGVTGKTEVVDTESGTAVAYDIRAGNVAWVDGVEITGTLPTRTLSDLSTAVADGYYVATNLVLVDADLATPNIHAGITMFGITGKTEVVDTTTGDAVPFDIMAGKIAWVDGYVVTGTIPTYTISSTTTVVQAGYYAATNLVAVETDLVDNNIKSGVELFGVAGTMIGEVLPKTGQTNSYAVGDDGDLQKGGAWPEPRFTDNGDGTVADNLTDLVWMKNADAFGTCYWTQALVYCNSLSNGMYGLSDGSVAGDWRLPNKRELESLIDLSQNHPCLPAGHSFTNWQADFEYYWTASTFHSDTLYAWILEIEDGTLSVDDRETSDYNHVWPCRDE